MTLRIFSKFGICLVALNTVIAFGHEGHAHHHSKPAGAIEASTARDQSVTSAIQTDYNQTAKPIFDQKCMDCHGGTPNFPWYYKIPGIRQMLDSDIAESKEHLDFSKGYPFGGHGTPVEDLEAIQKTINDGSMPPFLYRMMHPNSKFQAADREVVLGWTQRALKLLPPEKSEKRD